MDVVLKVIGGLMSLAGAALCLSGIIDDLPVNLVRGTVLLISGLSFLSVASIISLLKQIRDAHAKSE